MAARAKPPRLVVLRGSPAGVLDRIREVRSRGGVPLVGDERWPAAQWGAVHELAAAERVPDDAAWAALTSGSSGPPRVVLRTEASWQGSFATIDALFSAAVPAACEQRILLPSPPASSLSLYSLAHACTGGPRPVFSGDPDAETATLFHGTPHAFRRVIGGNAFPRLALALVGGSRLDPDLRTAAEARGVQVVAYYGAAELSFVALDQGEGLRAFPGVGLSVRGGELWVDSPFTALGYLGGSGPMRRDGAWATVGDLTSVEDGVLSLHGRSDGAILTASATVIPDEVEAGLRAHPEIADAVVFGLPAEGVGEVVAAMVEPKVDPGQFSAAQLRAFATAHFALAHRPRVWFTGPVPRTATGKPARAEVLRRVLAGEVARVA